MRFKIFKNTKKLLDKDKEAFEGMKEILLKCLNEKRGMSEDEFKKYSELKESLSECSREKYCDSLCEIAHWGRSEKLKTMINDMK